MSNIILPEVGLNETLSEYINRLIKNNIIQASQIPFAIQKFNIK